MKLFAIYLKTNNLSLKISLKNIDKSTKKSTKLNFIIFAGIHTF